MRDPLIVGGGIQGASLAVAATARGLRPVVVDGGGPAACASLNSYAVVHGGLRYLQSGSVRRWRQSRAAQHWFLTHYPQHVRPLRCVMPLYRGRLRSPGLFALARGADRFLRVALRRPVALPEDGRWNREAVLAAYPVPEDGLIGAALWHDAVLADAGALLATMLDEAERAGATVLRGWEATALDTRNGRVRGACVRRPDTGEERYVPTDTVADCGGARAGAWIGAERRAEIPGAGILAYNLVLDIPAPAGTDAFALSPDPGRGRSYFFRRQGAHTLAGTFYRPAPGASVAAPTEADIAAALDVVRRCLPGLTVGAEAVLAVQAGLLPDSDGRGERFDMADRHARPGPQGYHWIRGGKLTTAPLLSEAVADALWGQRPEAPDVGPVAGAPRAARGRGAAPHAG